MGRKGSKLIPFLKDALKEKKYSNLKFEDEENNIFSLFLPQNTNSLKDACQFILKDWYEVKNRSYKLKKDYTAAKQGMEAALRKSDFLEVVHKGRNTELIYRILISDEVEVKKSLKKAQKKASKFDPYSECVFSPEPSSYAESVPSPESSGYGSGSDNYEVFEDDGSHALLHVINHDHEYMWNEVQATLNELNVENNFVTNRPSVDSEDTLGYDNILPFEQNSISNLGIIGLLDNIFPDDINSSPTQDPFVEGITLNSRFVGDVIEDLGEELCIDSHEYPVKEEILAISGMDISSYKTETVKVYECLNRQNMPDMIMLTCEPKPETTTGNKMPEENQDSFENGFNNRLNVQLERNINDNLEKPAVLQKEDECDIIVKHIAKNLRQLLLLDVLEAKREMYSILLKYRKEGRG